MCAREGSSSIADARASGHVVKYSRALISEREHCTRELVTAIIFFARAVNCRNCPGFVFYDARETLCLVRDREAAVIGLGSRASAENPPQSLRGGTEDFRRGGEGVKIYAIPK